MEEQLYRLNVGLGFSSHATVEAVAGKPGVTLCGREGRSTGRSINMGAPGVCRVCRKSWNARLESESEVE